MPAIFSRPVLGGLLGAALLFSGTARADEIDGHWCGPDKRLLTIQGPSITTPGGKQIKGDYDRHAFSYVVPEGEPGTGATVAMRLLNQQTMRLHPPNGAAEQIWRRCAAAVS
jgi:hypothetical protein